MFGQRADVAVREDARRRIRCYEGTDDIVHLRAAAELFARAAELSPNGSPDEAADLAEVSRAYWILWYDLREIWTLDRSIDFGRAAIARIREQRDWASAAMIVGAALTAKYKVTQQKELLVEALAALRGAYSAPELDDQKRPFVQLRLADALEMANQDVASAELINEAIVLCRSASARPHDHRNGAMVRLGRLLVALAEHLEDAGPLQEAETVMRQLVQWASPTQRVDRLLELARLHETRFHYGRDAADLQRAVQLCREAIEVPSGGPERSLASIRMSGLVDLLREQGVADGRLPLPPPPS